MTSAVRGRAMALFGEFALEREEVRDLILRHTGAEDVTTCVVSPDVTYAWVIVTGNNANLLTPGSLMLGQGASAEDALDDLFWRVMARVLLG